jgi:squalene-hopene/tetraprenyl-beta-curcumene cyclase
MGTTAWRICALTACLAAGLLVVWMHAETKTDGSWDERAAADYLDRRESQWMAWPQAARDHGTFCISCHTAMPYALARPALRAALSEQTPTADERKLIENVTKRVRLWKDVQPYYTGTATQSRGTEAVLNALILASYDAQSGQMTTDTRVAFDNMWELQENSGDNKGAWRWIQFDNEPWEAPDSPYYGACLAAVAVGIAPRNYSSTPAIRDNLKLLREYLERESAAQSPINRVALLWASATLPEILSAAQQQSIVDEILSKQRADGGWSVSSLVGAWERDDGTPLVSDSDGYATGLIVFVLEQIEISRGDVHVKEGLSWLVRNQSRWGGQWPAYSLNRRRHNPFSMVARFMGDSATAYAVLALTQAKNPTKGQSGTFIQPKESALH